MVVDQVVAVQVAAPAAALADGPEGELAQPPHFAQHGRVQRAAEQVDALAVRRLPQQCAGAHGLGQRTAVHRMGDSRLGVQQAGPVLRHTVQVLAEQLGLGRVRQGHGAVAAVRDGVADAQGYALAVLAEHLLHQQQRGQRLVAQGGAIEQGRVAAVDVDGHDGRLRLRRQPQKAAVPAPVAHAARAQARDLAGREDDDCPLAAQVLQDGLELPRAAVSAQHRDRQQQALEGRERGEQAVGDDLHVAADAAHQVEQRQPVERAQGVVGNDDHAPARRNALALVVAHRVAEGEMLQHLLDERKALQVRVLLGEMAEALLVQQAAQHAAHALAQPRMPLQLRQVQVDDLVHGDHGAHSQVHAPEGVSGTAAMLRPCHDGRATGP